MTTLNQFNLLSNFIENSGRVISIPFRTNIKEDDIIQLSVFLSNTCEVTQIDFHSSKIGAKNIKLLAQSLYSNQSVKFLDLSACEILDEGAIHIGKMIGVNQTLTLLELEGNKITDIGLNAIAEGLKKNRTLESLRIGKNTFGRDGLNALCDAIKVNSSLKQLYLADNSFTVEMIQDLSSAFQRNSSIQYLNIRSRSLNSFEDQYFQDFLENNYTLTTFVHGLVSEVSLKIQKKMQYNKEIPDKIFLLLLLSRTHDTNSPFYKHYLPLDIFKYILEITRLDHLKLKKIEKG